MPRFFEVISTGVGVEARRTTISALPAWVEAMGCAATFAPTEEDLRQIEGRLVERSRDRVREGFKVVWRIADDGARADGWVWLAAPAPRPGGVVTPRASRYHRFRHSRGSGPPLLPDFVAQEFGDEDAEDRGGADDVSGEPLC
jgi:hypothetical protein